MTLALILILIVAVFVGWPAPHEKYQQALIDGLESCALSRREPKAEPQQQRVIELVAAGLTNREAAEKLGIDAHVVRNYFDMIYDKIGVSNRVELALWYEARVLENKAPWRSR